MKANYRLTLFILLSLFAVACDSSSNQPTQEKQDATLIDTNDMQSTDQMIQDKEVLPPILRDQMLVDMNQNPTDDQMVIEDLYVDLGPVTINSIIPNRGTIAGGTDVQIIGTGFSQTTVFTFDRFACQELQIISQNKAKCKTPSTSVEGEVDVKALDTRIENGMEVPYQGYLEKAYTYYIPLEVTEITPNRGSIYGGLRVTMSGQGFEEGTLVQFNRQRASEIVINANNTITVTVPPSATSGFVDVSLSNFNGQITLARAFYYYEPLNIDQITPAVGSSVGGTNVTITGTGLNPNSRVLFNQNPAELRNANGTQMEVVTPSNQAGYATIEITNDNGDISKRNAFLYYDDQAQGFDVLGIQPQNGPVNGGQNVYIAGSGFNQQTQVDFNGAQISCQVIDAHQLNCITPPGQIGNVTVDVRQGNQTIPVVGGYDYYDTLELYSIFPDKGSIAGGTVVTLTGKGFGMGMEVFLGELALVDLQIIDEFTAIGTTVPAAVSTVDVIVKNQYMQQKLVGGYQYFDPTAGFGGVWGQNLDAAMNITVLHATSQMPLAEVDVFLISNDGMLSLSGQTNSFGQVTLSDENLRGFVDITAAKEGFEVTTIENAGVENITIFLVPNTSEMGPMPPGVPPAILKGTVRGIDFLPKPNNETYVNIALVETTHDNLTNRGDLPPPGPGGLLLEDGPFEITSRLGELAVVVTAGRVMRIYLTEYQAGNMDYLTFRDQLEPSAMGVRRFVSAREGETIEGLHVEIDHPLDYIIPVDLDNPPLDRVNGPSVYAVLPILNMASEGFWQLYGTAIDLTPNLSLNTMPRLAGWEDDIRYIFVGLALNPNTPSQTPLTITMEETRAVDAGVLITPFVSPAKPINPVEDGTLGPARILAWSSYEGFDGPMRQADAMVVSIAEPALGPPKPLWKYVVPRGVNQVEIPILPTTSGEAGLNNSYMILQMNPFISESGFDYNDFTYFDINGSRWKSWGVTSFGFMQE